MKNTFLYLPDNINLSIDGFLDGTVSKKTNSCSIFIVDKKNHCSSETIGTCGCEEIKQIGFNKEDLLFHLDAGHNKIEMYKDRRLKTLYENCKCVFYNHEGIKNVQVPLDGFEDVLKAVQLSKSVGRAEDPHRSIKSLLSIIKAILGFLNKAECLLKYSQVFNHLKNSLRAFEWALVENGSKLKVTSITISKILDIILGVLLIYFYWTHEMIIINLIKRCTQNIILCLKSVLNTLMDSPGGLKLNYNLNRSLAIFFFYHISLWRIFIYSIEPLMPLILKVILMTGVFGLSFQVALFSDMISFLTLHVYCLYVYASRLYRLQTYGLISLWKLFLGRKYNPLRNRVDSFQYSHNQLFIGTLGFTIFLFLLPTTFLYYAVFTLFRSMLLTIKRMLCVLTFMLNNIPIYTCTLWICNSYKIKGDISIEIIKKDCNYILYANLKTIPIMQCIIYTLPPNYSLKETTSIKLLINNLIKGNLL